ncbi:hypothetical protein R1T08_34045 [Streptomyces sp. SBC-4]|nr:hypothetical protein [Streptomyces sp. SBC-4]MDV5149026.1 hypothetical protein [Streptomyces sp. SBC-4]
MQPFRYDTDVPLTRQLSRGELTQAIPDAEDVVPGYYPGNLHKNLPGEPDDCAPPDAPAPAGWQRAGSGEYDYQESSRSREIDLDVCQFDNVAHAKTAYDRWQDDSSRSRQAGGPRRQRPRSPQPSKPDARARPADRGARPVPPSGCGSSSRV